jgi:hypothetical protein
MAVLNICQNSVSTQIKRLGKDPSLSSTVQILRKILSKQKKKEFEEQPQATPCE